MVGKIQSMHGVRQTTMTPTTGTYLSSWP